MKTLLITGASGFIGGVCAVRAADMYHVVGTCHSNRPDLPGIEWVRLDMRDKQAVEACLLHTQPDAVIHLAAQSNLDLCEANPGEAYAVNVDAVKHLCESASAHTRIVAASSDMVYNGRKSFVKEKSGADPLNVYGRTKKQAEEVLLRMRPDAAAVRIALVYGRPVTPARSCTENMIRDCMSGNELLLFTDQFRSPVPVVSLADALMELAANTFSGVMNAGGSQRISRYEFGRLLFSIAGLDMSRIIPSKMEDVQFRAKRPGDTSLDISVAQKILHTILPNCRQGLEAAYGLYHPPVHI